MVCGSQPPRRLSWILTSWSSCLYNALSCRISVWLAMYSVKASHCCLSLFDCFLWRKPTTVQTPPAARWKDRTKRNLVSQAIADIDLPTVCRAIWETASPASVKSSDDCSPHWHWIEPRGGLEARTAQLSHSQIFHKQMLGEEISSRCCFKLPSFGVICYAVKDS